MQRNLAAARSQGAIPDTIVLCEHPPTLTLGRSSDESELPLGRDGYAALGWDDRGDRPRRPLDLARPGPARRLPDPRPARARQGPAPLRARSRASLVLALGRHGDRGHDARGPRVGRRLQRRAARSPRSASAPRAGSCVTASRSTSTATSPRSAQFHACGLDVPFTSVSHELGRPFTVADAREPVLRRLGEVLELDVVGAARGCRVMTLQAVSRSSRPTSPRAAASTASSSG